MALEVTTLFHGTEEALKAQSNCEKLFLGHKESWRNSRDFIKRNSFSS